MASTYKSVPISQPAQDSSSGGGGDSTPLYEQTFTTTDWNVSGSEFIITLLASNHGQGTEPMVQIDELDGSSYVSVDLYYQKNSSGDITIRVGNGSRFNGRILIRG